MQTITPDQFQALLPLACAWAEEQERLIGEAGGRLTTAQMDDANLVGVAQPERVRLLEVEQIPLPENPRLRAAAKATRLLWPDANGVTLRYGIFIRSRFWGERCLIVHELVHTAQYERLGGFRPFLDQYLRQCLTVGYPACPMEQEAVQVAASICSNSKFKKTDRDWTSF